MATTYSAVESYGVGAAPGILKRVSWGAIFAGLVVSLVIGLLLNLLGIGIGLGAIDPATSNNPFSGIGTGAAIWLGISTLIALFVGGWITAKLAGSVRGLIGVLHSLVLWGLVTLVTFYLMGTALGSLFSGAAGVVGTSLSLASKGIEAVAPQASEKIKEQMQQSGINVDSIMNEAKQLLSETGKPELQPDQIQRDAEWNAQAAAQGTEGAKTPEAVEQELRQSLQKVFATGQQKVNAADREALVNVLVSRSNMTRPEAEQTVNGWIQKYQQVAQDAQAVKQTALQSTENAMDTLSKVGIWMFILLLLEAIAAGLGGWLGSSRHMRYAEVAHSERS